MTEHIHEWTGSDVIWDVREMPFDTTQAEDVRSLSQNMREVGQVRRGLRTAIVCSTEYSYGLMRMFELMTEDHVGITIQVFLDLDQAIEWLKGSG